MTMSDYDEMERSRRKMNGALLTWLDYAEKALQKKCYAPAHELTYPLISLQTELSELNDALRKLADRAKHPFPPYSPDTMRSEPLLAHAREELGDVIWAYTSLTWAMNWVTDSSENDKNFALRQFWETDFAKLEEQALLSATAKPCKLKTAVPAIYTHLNLVADYVCKRLRAGEERITGFPNSKVNDMLLLTGLALVRIAKSLGTTLERTMQYQLDKMNARESEGKFVVLTSLKTN